MNLCEPPQRRSKRDDGSATSGFPDDRLKRATTVLPLGSVKFTKKRPDEGKSGEKARPRRPRSPPAEIDADRSRNGVGCTAPPWMTRIRPPCSTTYCREAT